jgi:hypothetical protein
MHLILQLRNFMISDLQLYEFLEVVKIKKRLKIHSLPQIVFLCTSF